MSTQRFIQISALLLGLLLAAFYKTEAVCEKFGGKWGSAQRTCFTPLCYDAAACGEWACPQRECQSVKPGSSERQLHFQLGNPSRRDGERQYWHACKGEQGEISALIRDSHVVEILCKAIRETKQK